MGDASNLADVASGSPGGLPSQAGDSSSGFNFSKGGASAASIAGLGLSVFSSIEKGKGTQAGYEFQAAKAERAAEFGKLQAQLTDTSFREELNTTLSNIDVIRAAAHIDPTSPTTAAVEGYSTMLSDRQRTAALLNINSKVAENLSDANYLRQAGDFALKSSYLNAGVQVASAVGKAGLAAA